MVNNSSQNPSLGEAARLFLAKLSPSEREPSQPEVYKFVRWFGSERPLTGLSAPEVANYAERLSSSDTDYSKKLVLLRAFLTHAKKAGWSQLNLAIHLKAKKTKTGPMPSLRQGLPETIQLTQQGYTELETELAALMSKRPQLIEEMRRAAADKDFSENAPLAAAREQRGHLEGRIRELEETLKLATIINDDQRPAVKANIGDSIILRDLTSREELRYMIVDPKEVDPVKGKISSASPLGKAFIGRGEGETVEVAVPAGKLRYQIKRIEH